MEQKTNSMTEYAGFFVTGAAIGAVLGVIFAPKAGHETRKDVRLWLKEKREKIGNEHRVIAEALQTGRKAFAAKEKELTGG